MSWEGDHVIEPPDPLYVDGDEGWSPLIESGTETTEERVQFWRVMAVIATLLAFLLGLLIGRST
jgi:hypothetical protein